MSNGLSVRVLFFLALAAVACGFLSAPIALATGILFGVLFTHPYEQQSRTWAKRLLQLSVVALGFGINFAEVVHAGRASFLYTALSLTLAMALGLLLGKLLHVRPKAAFLISAGTAICGGSAIAALAPITHPDKEELGMSLGTIFILNSVALFTFPIIGMNLHLTQTQFGLWSALAIHDTSSVVGAAARYGSQALAVGTVVKLTRALWIVPVAFLTAALSRSKTRVQFPWFILAFCLAALAKNFLPALTLLFAKFSQAGHIGLALTLFLIGTGISRRTIQQTGVRVMAQGVLLWIAVATASLLAIRAGWMSL